MVHWRRWNDWGLCDRCAATLHLPWYRQRFAPRQGLRNTSWKSWILYECLCQHWMLSTATPIPTPVPLLQASCCHKHPLAAGVPVSCDSSLIPGLIWTVISLLLLPAHAEPLTFEAGWIIPTRGIFNNHKQRKNMKRWNFSVIYNLMRWLHFLLN